MMVKRSSRSEGRSSKDEKSQIGLLSHLKYLVFLNASSLDAHFFLTHDRHLQDALASFDAALQQHDRICICAISNV